MKDTASKSIGPDGPRAYVELLFLSKTGPFIFEVEAPDGMNLPITSGCDTGQTTMYFAVFSDTTFYVDDALAEEACMLPAGTYAMGGGGYSSGGEGNLAFRSASEPQRYKIRMNGLADLCNGHSETFVSVDPSGSSLSYPHPFGLSETSLP